jgi:hypothetical protein
MKILEEIFGQPAYLVCFITMLNAWALAIFNRRYKAAETENKPILENPDAKPRDETIATIKNGLTVYREGIITSVLNAAILVLCLWWLLSGPMPKSRFEVFAIAILPILIWNSADVASDLWRTRRIWRALRLLVDLEEKKLRAIA